MRETPISESEKVFILEAIKNNQRIDGRKNDEFRNVRIKFGSDVGSVLVCLGESKVLAQVTCELGTPKANRPNEGSIYINVDLGKMAAPNFESNRYSDLGLQINRVLERTFKESNCVDVESLCITAEECVWALRVDVNVLNHEGNLIDCCSIAVLCALAHFKRPDVTIVSNEVLVCSVSEKEPIPIVLHHYPVCVTYCTVDDGERAVADPTVTEERVADSIIVFGLNSFQELCCMNLGGTSLTSVPLLLRCVKDAAKRAKDIVELVKACLKEDEELRTSKQFVGFNECVRLNTISGLAEDRLTLKLRNFNFKNIRESSARYVEKDINNTAPVSAASVISIGEHAAIMNSDQSNIKWIPDEDEPETNSFNSEDSIDDSDDL